MDGDRIVHDESNDSRPDETGVISVLHPCLPPVDALVPYLRRIDASRTYTNWGPLVEELESRLCRLLRLPPDALVTASSGTAALVGAILASAGRAQPGKPLAAIPAFTFVATAVAVEQCGYQPYLVDVDPDTWLLDATRLQEHMLIDRIGLVVPVGAFGRPVHQEAWLAFRARTGIPVVIDAAASFESFAQDSARCAGDIPAALSFHATKSFATAEGGCVITTDPRLSRSIEESLNFGFYSNRRSNCASTNGKMSEYHAAIGLAELDRWAEKSTMIEVTVERYRERLHLAGLDDRFVGRPVVASCYALYRCASLAEAARVQDVFRRSDIEFRFWYGAGLLEQPYFSNLPHDGLEHTKRLAPLIIGLPIAVDLSSTAMNRIATALQAAAERR